MNTFPRYENGPEEVPPHSDFGEPSPPLYTPRFTVLTTLRGFVEGTGYSRLANTHSSRFNSRRSHFISRLLAISVSSALALVLSLVLLLPHDDWYVLQVDNTNARPGVLFRNVILNQNFSATITRQYTINDTDLAPYFRVGLMNWCEGDIVEGAWVKGNCHEWLSLDLGQFYAETAGHVGTYEVTSNDSSIVYLPPGYPSSDKITKNSKYAKSAATGCAVFNALILVGALILWCFDLDETAFLLLAVMIMTGILDLSLMSAIARGPYYLAGRMIEAFQNQIDLFGVELTRTAHVSTFAGLASVMTGCALLFSFIAVCAA